MKRFPLFLYSPCSRCSPFRPRADIIDDTIGNIQQAINDAYNLTVGETMKIRATTAGSVK